MRARVATILLCLLCSITVLLTVTLAKRGVKVLSIVSSSMSPSCPLGSLVLSVRQPAAAYQVGDVVTFRAPTKRGQVVTHRILGFAHAGRLTTVRTKGDANPNGDPWQVPVAALWGKSLICIPALGVGGLLLSTYAGFLCVALVSTALLVWMLFIYFNESNHTTSHETLR
jgi:signal peptidase I